MNKWMKRERKEGGKRERRFSCVKKERKKDGRMKREKKIDRQRKKVRIIELTQGEKERKKV